MCPQNKYNLINIIYDKTDWISVVFGIVRFLFSVASFMKFLFKREPSDHLAAVLVMRMREAVCLSGDKWRSTTVPITIQ